MQRAVFVAALTSLACSSTPERFLGRVSDHAGELLGALCAETASGNVEPDDKFVRARLALLTTEFPPEVEAVRCGPQPEGGPTSNVIVFDEKTRRLFGLAVDVHDRDVKTLDELVLPTLGGVERVGYELEKARAATPALLDVQHSWNDGHTRIWSFRVKHADRATDTFEIGIFVRD